MVLVNKLLKEAGKSVFLFCVVALGILLINSFREPFTAKALKYKEVNEPNGISLLTREEKDEYMQYLRVLSGYTYEGGPTNTILYKLELP